MQSQVEHTLRVCVVALEIVHGTSDIVYVDIRQDGECGVARVHVCQIVREFAQVDYDWQVVPLGDFDVR